jgi:Rab3 GTPase-activating protein catalytic subunit
LPEQYNLVDQLLYKDQSIVKEGVERSSVFQLFRNDRKFQKLLLFLCHTDNIFCNIEGIISKPSFREYVLYSNCKDLTTNNRALPTRQYAIFKDNEIRIMDMQTIDALYY